MQVSRLTLALAVAAVGIALAVTALHSTAAEATGKDALIKRGEYLVNEVARCGDCHTPMGKDGQFDKTRHLQGGKLAFIPRVKPKEWEDEAPDITASGKGGRWSQEKWVRYLTSGKGSEAPMPPYKLAVEDARAIAAYCASLPGNPNKRERKED